MYGSCAYIAIFIGNHTQDFLVPQDSKCSSILEKKLSYSFLFSYVFFVSEQHIHSPQVHSFKIPYIRVRIYYNTWYVQSYYTSTPDVYVLHSVILLTTIVSSQAGIKNNDNTINEHCERTSTRID